MAKNFYTTLLAIIACVGSNAPMYAQNETERLPDFDENNVSVVTDRPDGELKYYSVKGFEVEMTSDGLETGNQSGVTSIVFGKEGDIWIMNPISNDQRGSWVKGSLASDNVTLTVETGQFVDYMPSLEFGRQLWVLDYDETSGTYSVNPSVKAITFEVSDDAIKLTGTSENRIIGSVFRAKGETEEEYHYEGRWSGYGNYDSEYTPYADQALTVPENAVGEAFTFRAPVSSSGLWSLTVTDATLYTTADDEVYLKGFCSSDAYFKELDWVIKGDKRGDKLIFPTGQFLGVKYGNVYYLTGEESDADGVCDITFTFSPTGEWETDDVIKFVDSKSSTWSYFYYDGATLSKNPLPEMVTVPESAKEHLCKMTYQGYIQSIDFYYDSQQNLTLAYTDNKVFIKGLYYGLPDAVVEGDVVDGNKVVFKSPQYMGKLDERTPELWFMAFGDDFSKPLDKIEFDYDSKSGKLSNASGNISASICNRRNLGFQWFFTPAFEVIDVVAAIPANPQNLDWITDEWDNDAVFVFEIPEKDVNGEDLVDNWLGYSIYTDTKEDGEELFAMTPDTYPDMNLSEPLSVFPVNYFGFDITYSYGRHYVTIRTDWKKYNRIGVQSVYEAGGEENRSEIIWYDLSNTDVENVNNDDVLNQNTIYDMQGRIVSGEMLPGIYICNGKKFIVR